MSLLAAHVPSMGQGATPEGDLGPLTRGSYANEPIPARLLWVVRQLHQMSRLVTTVHARVEHSTAFAEWHPNFHLLTGSSFRVELKNAGVATSTVEAEVMIGIFTIEGLLMHPMSDEEQRTICHALAERWSPGRVRRPMETEKDPDRNHQSGARA